MFSHIILSGASAVYDPAILDLSGWWRANYGGSPWTSTASAGTSGSRSMSEATNPFTGGTAVNGYTPAHLDGTNDKMTLDTNLGALIAETPYTVIALIKLNAAAAPAAQIYDNPQIIAGAGGTFGFAFNTNGMNGYQTSGAGFPFDTTAFGTGAWGMCRFKRDATKLYTALNSGAWSAGTVCASGNISVAARSTIFGRDDDVGNAFLNADVLEIITSKLELSDANHTSIRSYFNSRYVLSL